MEAQPPPRDEKPATIPKDTPPEHDKPHDDHQEQEQAEEPVVKFSPEEEAHLLAESNTRKSQANALFNRGSYTDALAAYADATASCPTYLDYELAVLHSNIAACHLKLAEWKAAVASATAALERLDRVDDGQLEKEEEEEDVEEEIVSAGAAGSGPALQRVVTRRSDVKRIRYKALMRRARARSEAGGWSDLSGAEADYKALAEMDNLSAGDSKIVREQLRTLPARTKAAQERETAEMWKKLKELGNGILKPFGLSTDNFNMVKDDKTGGYSMNFNN